MIYWSDVDLGSSKDSSFDRKCHGSGEQMSSRQLGAQEAPASCLVSIHDPYFTFYRTLDLRYRQQVKNGSLNLNFSIKD